MAYNIDVAVKLLDVAIKYNDLRVFLIGGPGYELNAPNGYGVSEQNTTLAMQAIYKKYATDPTIKDKLQAEILDYLNFSKNGSVIVRLLDIIKYQMSSEKVGTAPFKLECEKLLVAAKENIIRNKELYTEYFAELPSGTFLGEFKRFDEDFNNKCGMRIL